MAFDQITRNRLARFVSDARALLTEEFTRQLQNEYGLDPASGDVTAIDRLTALDDRRRETARILREALDYYLAGDIHVDGKAKRDVLDRIVREQAFTVLNRLCAIRMSEARDLILESVAKGYQSKGFQLYARLAGSALGETGDTYRIYLLSLMDEFSVDLPVLFDRFSPQGRLFPREAALLKLLELINDPDIENLWAEDETLGWIYQYFNLNEERQEMRLNRSPQNSRELAVRNQFFTPRYVVEFLVDNTLGRIWYEMTKGKTVLKDTCRYLVRRPNEIFLGEDEAAPDQPETDENSTQEDLLLQPVYISHRPLKDPREIKMLDPACGSMHFGLYAFDLFEQIYTETWELEERLGEDALQRLANLDSLHKTYPDKETFAKDIPRLIIEHNIHGVDIDPRAVQISGLSLWMRAQKSWQEQGLYPSDRPQIHKSNVVCAEPMPGDRQMLEEFLGTLSEVGLEELMRKAWSVPSQQKVRVTPQMAEALAKLVRTVWQEMELAGEAGSLLKIEETMREAIATARKESEEKSPLFHIVHYGLNEDPKGQYVRIISGEDQDFFDRAEELVLEALQEYSKLASNSQPYKRYLFSGDVTHGFAMIDIFRQRYDVVLMNPPFGEPSMRSKDYVEAQYTKTKGDILTNFIERALGLLEIGGKIGTITSRTCFFLTTQSKFRQELLQKEGFINIFADFGHGVLDAMVETAAYTLSCDRPPNGKSIFIRCLKFSDKATKLKDAIYSIRNCEPDNNIFIIEPYEFSRLKGSPYCYWISRNTIQKITSFPILEGNFGSVRVGLQTGQDWRFLRLVWEVPSNLIGGSFSSYESVKEIRSHFISQKRWAFYSKTERALPWFSPITMVVDWYQNGYYLKENVQSRGYSPSKWVQSENLYFFPGFSYMGRSTRIVPFIIPKGVIPMAGRSQVFPKKGFEYDLLGYLSSQIASGIARFSGGAFGQPMFQASTFQNLPVPKMSKKLSQKIMELIDKEFYSKRSLAEEYEPYQEFLIPGILRENSSHNTEWSRFSLLGPELELEIANEMGLTQAQLDELSRDTRESLEMQYLNHDEFSNEYYKENDDQLVTDLFIEDNEKTRLEEFMSYSVGVIFGRWDIRFALDHSLFPKSPGAFDLLPICPPGTLKGPTGLPATKQEAPENYPLQIAWTGILAGDPNKSDNIENRIREIIHLIWQSKAELIEQDFYLINGVKSLSEYFLKPMGFFADHLKRYTMNRRQAPIYWPLSTPSCSYTLWLYYHRLNDQTLYTCVNDFVDPKLKQVSEDAACLRQKKGRSTADERELEHLMDFERELKDYREELLRIAKFWKPDLNDGVEITAAPLWKLFQYKPWQKRLKGTWEKLEAGEFDWANLAYSIWPERVREKCKTDKSLAIAHGLEELYMEPPSSAKKKKAKKTTVDKETEGWFNDD